MTLDTNYTNSSWIDNVRNETRKAKKKHEENYDYIVQKEVDLIVEYFKEKIEKRAKQGHHQMWIPAQNNYVKVKLQKLGLDIIEERHSKHYCYGITFEDDEYGTNHFERNKDNKSKCILCESRLDEIGFLLSW